MEHNKPLRARVRELILELVEHVPRPLPPLSVTLAGLSPHQLRLLVKSLSKDATIAQFCKLLRPLGFDVLTQAFRLASDDPVARQILLSCMVSRSAKTRDTSGLLPVAGCLASDDVASFLEQASTAGMNPSHCATILCACEQQHVLAAADSCILRGDDTGPVLAAFALASTTSLPTAVRSASLECQQLMISMWLARRVRLTRARTAAAASDLLDATYDDVVRTSILSIVEAGPETAVQCCPAEQLQSVVAPLLQFYGQNLTSDPTTAPSWQPIVTVATNALVAGISQKALSDALTVMLHELEDWTGILALLLEPHCVNAVLDPVLVHLQSNPSHVERLRDGLCALEAGRMLVDALKNVSHLDAQAISLVAAQGPPEIVPHLLVGRLHFHVQTSSPSNDLLKALAACYADVSRLALACLQRSQQQMPRPTAMVALHKALQAWPRAEEDIVEAYLRGLEDVLLARPLQLLCWTRKDVVAIMNDGLRSHLQAAAQRNPASQLVDTCVEAVADRKPPADIETALYTLPCGVLVADAFTLVKDVWMELCTSNLHVLKKRLPATLSFASSTWVVAGLWLACSFLEKLDGASTAADRVATDVVKLVCDQPTTQRLLESAALWRPFRLDIEQKRALVTCFRGYTSSVVLECLWTSPQTFQAMSVQEVIAMSSNLRSGSSNVTGRASKIPVQFLASRDLSTCSVDDLVRLSATVDHGDPTSMPSTDVATALKGHSALLSAVIEKVGPCDSKETATAVAKVLASLLAFSGQVLQRLAALQAQSLGAVLDILSASLHQAATLIEGGAPLLAAAFCRHGPAKTESVMYAAVDCMQSALKCAADPTNASKSKPARVVNRIIRLCGGLVREKPDVDAWLALLGEKLAEALTVCFERGMAVPNALLLLDLICDQALDSGKTKHTETLAVILTETRIVPAMWRAACTLKGQHALRVAEDTFTFFVRLIGNPSLRSHVSDAILGQPSQLSLILETAGPSRPCALAGNEACLKDIGKVVAAVLAHAGTGRDQEAGVVLSAVAKWLLRALRSHKSSAEERLVDATVNVLESLVRATPRQQLTIAGLENLLSQSEADFGASETGRRLDRLRARVRLALS